MMKKDTLIGCVELFFFFYLTFVPNYVLVFTGRQKIGKANK